MDLRALTTFEAILRLGSFQKAAEELQFAPSTVTLQIQRLEADLGVSLFVRDGKRMVASEAGQWLYQEASALLKQIGSMRQTISDFGTGDGGAVRFAAIEPIASQTIATIVADFCKLRPQVQLSMEISGSKSIAERVRSGELDFGICASPSVNLMLEFEPLIEERLGVLMRADHPMANQACIEVNDLVGLTILLKEQTCIYREISEKILCQTGQNSFFGIEVGSFSVIRQMVKAGLGIGIIPMYKDLELENTLVIRPFVDIDPTVSIGLVYKNSNILGKASLLLMNALREVKKQNDFHSGDSWL
ncbi:LysR family transcriptional regulator [Paenibacillus sp. CGMCC 1.16610]|uniref:LysR family transcriptional regulator n=1 Tax=Paenibacillus anseongense TaxID=2682845 RepID=A0ABW9UHT9_9BACL|nr:MULTISPECIES: LysR family transcriptional regulator [Paenibacillus]MBA2939778.1 LysR family transcriptional regulator [Paenibacillus sp. CGMCC 1.16610]MVQ39438.1 LysR family transcriptional regulator [Paenibacillus anseongense]